MLKTKPLDEQEDEELCYKRQLEMTNTLAPLKMKTER